MIDRNRSSVKGAAWKVTLSYWQIFPGFKTSSKDYFGDIFRRIRFSRQISTVKFVKHLINSYFLEAINSYFLENSRNRISIH